MKRTGQSLMCLFFVLISCSGASVSDSIETQKNEAQIQRDSISNLDSISANIEIAPEEIDRVPSSTFMDFLQIIQEFGFISDTSRINRVPYYRDVVATDQVFIKDSTPFYKIDTEKNILFVAHSNLSGHRIDLDPLRRIFARSISRTGYYFTDMANSITRTDGMIEEWRFENEELAEEAEREIRRTHRDIYHNSLSYIGRNKENLFILYSRANWDSRRMHTMATKLGMG